MTIFSVFKMLRPLKFLHLSPSKNFLNFKFIFLQALKHSCNAMLDSFLYISNFLCTFLFILILFGILGLHLFLGVTENRCRTTPLPINDVWNANENYSFLCGGVSCPSKLIIDLLKNQLLN